ncbi:MAG: hypothetical protein WCK89_10375 [bacterium]
MNSRQTEKSRKYNRETNTIDKANKRSDYGRACRAGGTTGTGSKGTFATGTHGSMQVHNVGALQTLFGMSNWGADNQMIALGIGNQVGGSNAPDWTLAANAGTAYGRRILYVLVHRTVTTVTTLPPAVVANVPDVANYQLAYTINLPLKGSFNTPASAASCYIVNNTTNGLARVFSRIADGVRFQETGYADPDAVVSGRTLLKRTSRGTGSS